MSNIRDIRQNSIRDIESKTVQGNKKNQNLQPDYSFTDGALEDLIAQVEAEGMLHPPKGFHDDVISRIRRKRKFKKSLQLFSYSMKVITATAAAVGIVLIVPGNINTQESHISGYVSEWQESNMSGIVSEWKESDGTDAQKTSQNGKEPEGENKAQEKIQQEIQKRSQKEEARREREKNQYARKIERLQNGNFIHQLNRQMDEYVDIVNGKLDQFIRMEVNINEKEEK